LGRSIYQLYRQNIQAKELEASSEHYIDLLAKGIGKPREEIAQEVQRTRFFQAQEAVDFGIADKIMDFGEDAFEKRVIITSLIYMFIFHKHFMHDIYL
jgi:ATP-dependent protease ClpP protease subunit